MSPWGAVIVLIASAFSLRAQTALTYYQAGSKAFVEQRFDAAIEALNRSLALDAKQAGAVRLLGLAYQLTGQLDQAELKFTDATRLSPKDGEGWFYLGRVYYVENFFDRALSALLVAVKYAPNDARIRECLALTYEATADWTAAEREYQQARRVSRTESGTIDLNYGALLLKVDRIDESEKLLAQAVVLLPGSWQAHFELAKLYQQTGRFEAALRELKAALECGPKPEEAARTKGLIGAIHARLEGKAPLPYGRGSDGGSRGSDGGSPIPAIAIRFVDDAARAGIPFVLRNHATPEKHQVETMPGGVAVLDFDNDGFDDLYFVNGASVPGLAKVEPEDWNRLYRNNGDGTFTDVTSRAGVQGVGYGMGVAAADYDNDGWTDLFVAGVNRNLLFHNNGDGTFTDVTSRAGMGAEGAKPWSIGAAWLDYNNDGLLDLFVVNYCKWEPAKEPYCGESKPGYRTYCHPKHYEGLPNQLYRNNGDGTFTDVSAASGIGSLIGKGMGVAIADYDGDGRMDVFVANDTTPNFLLHNEGNGTFTEVGLGAGIALNSDGRALSSMGVDFRDVDNDGKPDVFVTALTNETFPLYRNIGEGGFADATYASRLAVMTLPFGGWGAGIYDLNNDGWKDIFAAASDVMDNAELFSSRTSRQADQVYVNLGNGTFGSGGEGGTWRQPRAHRGCAFGDFDNDGRVDVVVTSLGGPVEVLRNVSDPKQHWLDLALTGTRSNRDAIGATVRVTTSSGTQTNHVTTSVGYASSSSKRVHFGLGKDELATRIEIRWPSGTIQTLENVPSGQILKVTEPAAR